MPVELQITFNLIGTTTVVIGFIFATYQFVTFRRQRQQEVALTLMRTTAPPETFSREVRRIFALPDDASADAIHGLGPELEQAVVQACVNYENLGYLVYARLIPLRLTDDLSGGMIRMTWRKCRAYLGQFRQGNPSAFEWFEWLYDRLEEYPAPSRTSPAHVLHRGWKP
jgi:hypothetical protein